MKKKWYSLAAIVLTLLITTVAVIPVAAVEETPTTEAATMRALALDAPDVAIVGENVALTVTERVSGDAVKDAGIWAFTRENAQALREAIQFLRASATDGVRSAIDWEGLLNRYGEFLGYTNGAGKLNHAFDEAGGYLLIAFKDGYRPGVDRIFVRGLQGNALVLDVPNVARVGENVALTVTERVSGDAVKDAGIWAFTRENTQALREAIRSIRASATDGVRPGIDWEGLLNRYGEFLGYTNGAGKLNHAFDEAGGYLLIAFKEGYRPGVDLIRVRTSDTPALALAIADNARG